MDGLVGDRRSVDLVVVKFEKRMEVTGESGMSNPITDGNRILIRID